MTEVRFILRSTRYIINLNKLEDYFILDDPLENKMYSLLKEDLFKEEFEFNDFDQTAKYIAQKEYMMIYLREFFRNGSFKGNFDEAA